VRKGRVVAVGDDPVFIKEDALAEDGYAYTNKVGEEDKIVIRQRRACFPFWRCVSANNFLRGTVEVKSGGVNDS